MIEAKTTIPETVRSLLLNRRERIYAIRDERRQRVSDLGVEMEVEERAISEMTVEIMDIDAVLGTVDDAE